MSQQVYPDGRPFEDDYVCKAVCPECPFRTKGKRVVEINAKAAKRIARDVILHGKPFSCHMTSTPAGLGTEVAPHADWRFCAGAYLTMTEDERAHNDTLRVVKALGYHKVIPKGKSLVFKNLKAFTQHYARLERSLRSYSGMLAAAKRLGLPTTL